MAVAQRGTPGSVINSSASGTISFTVPSVVTAGDIWICSATFRGNTGLSLQINSLNLIASISQATSGSVSTTWVFWYRSNGTESGTFISGSISGAVTSKSVTTTVAFSGVDPWVPIVAGSLQNTSGTGGISILADAFTSGNADYGVYGIQGSATAPTLTLNGANTIASSSVASSGGSSATNVGISSAFSTNTADGGHAYSAAAASTDTFLGFTLAAAGAAQSATFVAPAASVLFASIDGKSWNAYPGPSVGGSNVQWAGVAYGNGSFVMVAQGGGAIFYYATSSNGIDWTASSMTGTAANYQLAFGGGTFVTGPGQTAGTTGYYSTNGTSWTAMTLPASDTWNITYGGGYFVAVGSTSGHTAYSTNGNSWTSGATIGAGYAYPYFGNGIFVVGTNNSTAALISSNNGVTWTSVTLATVFLTSLGVGTYGNGVYLMGGGSSLFNRSTNATSWASDTGGALSSGLGPVAYGNSLYVTVSGGSPFVSYSSDGNTWTLGTTKVQAAPAAPFQIAAAAAAAPLVNLFPSYVKTWAVQRASTW